MNKIREYMLGVCCWANVVACSAAERFDVLPDLPDPLAQAAQASTISKSGDETSLLASGSIGHEPNILSVVLSLIFVVLLIYVTGIVYAKLNKVGFKTLKKQQGEFSKSQVAVVSTTQLGNNKTLHVVELDGKRMLIGASTSAIQLIKDLGTFQDSEDDAEYSHIEIPNIKIPKIEIPKIEIPSIGFSKLVTKAHHKKDANGDVEDDNVAENKDSVLNEELNQDGIIDSLFQQEGLHDVAVEQENLNPSKEHIVDPDDYALYKKYLG